MSAEDYLKSKEIELFPVPNRQQEYYFIPKSQIAKRQRRNSHATNILNERRRHNTRTSKQFSSMNKTLGLISGGFKLLSNSYVMLAGLVLVVSAALLSLGQYLKTKNVTDSYASQDYDFSGRSTGKLSEKGLQFLISSRNEAFHAEAYKRENEQYWTIGYGHYGSDVKPGMVITEEEARKLLRQDIAEAENAVNKNVKVPISQNMFDALVSFTFNVGTGAFQESTLLKKLNAGDYKGAQQEFYKWTKDDSGKVLGGLVHRREKEAEMFGTDITSDNKLAVDAINPLLQYTDVNLEEYATKRQGGKGYADKTAVSGKIGNYITASGVQVGKSAAIVLSQIEGSGTITSGLGDQHAAGSKHYTGHAVDIGMGGVVRDKTIQTCINFLKHPAVAWVYVETKQNDLAWANSIVNTVKQLVPQLCKGDRITAGSSQYVTGRHLHVEFDYNYLQKVPKNNVNEENKNKAQEIPKIQPKSQTKPQAKTSKTQSKQNTTIQAPKKKEVPNGVNLSTAARKGKKKKL